MSVDFGRSIAFGWNAFRFAHFLEAFKEVRDSIKRNVDRVWFGLLVFLRHKDFSVGDRNFDLSTVLDDDPVHDDRSPLVIEFKVYWNCCCWLADEEALGFACCGMADSLDKARQYCSEKFSDFRIVDAVYFVD